MGLLKEVVEGLGLMKEGLENVTAIVEAVKDGRAYLQQYHPEARKDVELLLLELQKNLVLIAEVSGVVMRFRFDSGPSGSALQRFNDYYITQGGKAASLRQQIDQLRTRCSVVRQHASNVSEGVGSTAFQKFFEKLNVQAVMRRAELGVILDRLAYEDFANARSADAAIDCLEAALGDVQRALETDGVMRVENVPEAAALMKQYADNFAPFESQCQKTGSRITALVAELTTT